MAAGFVSDGRLSGKRERLTQTHDLVCLNTAKSK